MAAKARHLAILLTLAVGVFAAGALAQDGRADPAPDYTQPDAWLAHPGLQSHALDAPPDAARDAADGTDVFFIHPTTFLTPRIGNAAYDAGGETGARLEWGVLRFQAGVFNGCCRIYAPRYRQASLKAIVSDDPDSLAAADLAYRDVARAFDEFLKETHGRPFILAAHSQGSIHALRLLQERIIGTALQRRMIAAYLPGVSLPAKIADLGLPVCGAPASTGCVVSWNSERDGHDDPRRRNDAVIWWRGAYRTVDGRPLVCVNPLSWRIDGAAPADANLGGLPKVGEGEPLKPTVPAVTGARCEDGLLGVDVRLRDRLAFGDILSLTGVYHDFDYNLFYMNIRRNVSARIAAFASL